MENKGTKILETTRLVLRPFCYEDTEDMFKNWASDPEVTKFLTWPAHTDVEVTRYVLDSWIKMYTDLSFYNWGIELKDTNEVIGNISAVKIDERTQTADMGYCIGRKWWGQEIMPEALKAVITYFFDEVGFNRVAASHDSDNPKSGRVMEKAGMKFEGVLRASGINMSGICNVVWYSILKEEYYEKYFNVTAGSIPDSYEIVKEAKESFEKVLLNQKYSGIIKNDKHLKLLLNMLPIKKGDMVLDVGTGAGYLAFPIAQENKGCNVTGLDIAETVIQQNQLKAENQNINNLKFCSFDGINYPFGKESMDIIVTRYAFHHFPDIKRAVKHLSEILCKGGSILVSDPVRNIKDKDRIIDQFMKIKGDGHVRFYTQEEIVDLFSGQGVYLSGHEITNMKFPFPEKKEYMDLFNKLDKEEKALYNIYEEDGVVWIGNIEVANLLLKK